MSWHTTDVEGRKMYERSDGVRVSRTQDITAIEEAESAALSKSMNNTQPRYSFEDEEDVFEGEPLGVVGMAVVIGVMAIIMVIIGCMSKGFPS